jgi:hypothetical protein
VLQQQEDGGVEHDVVAYGMGLLTCICWLDARCADTCATHLCSFGCRCFTLTVSVLSLSIVAKDDYEHTMQCTWLI